METVIGCATKQGAQELFAAPAVDGKTFREQVEIYACGTGAYLSRLAAPYARKLAEKEDGSYIVWARSFMTGGNPRHMEEVPQEFFDVVFCLPVDALTDEMIEEFEEMAAFGGRSPRGRRHDIRGHGGPGRGPGSPGSPGFGKPCGCK